ncbi:MAG: hypothetical protein ACTSWP_06175 [Candidatus Freyarchaeota archaeon]|nr:hypothetical protein [Candidatus Freyrarchaeum guaymaensis]
MRKAILRVNISEKLHAEVYMNVARPRSLIDLDNGSTAIMAVFNPSVDAYKIREDIAIKTA